MKTLTHITDVGAPSGDGTDSNERIRKQYNALGVEPRIVTAGQSPLHVAFVACTDVAPQARDNVRQILAKLGLPLNPLPPTALNSAPRNAERCLPNGKEDHIFRVRYPDGETFLLYGPEVLSWVLAFRGREDVVLERVLKIADTIPDTSVGSQFRSSEHLPIAHFLESEGRLNDNSERELVDTDEVPRFDPEPDSAIVLPPDEYDNGRLLVGNGLFDEILTKNSIRLPGILNGAPVAVRPSLTDVEPYQKTGQFSVWPSSNHFPGSRHGVLNIGTRWQKGLTRTAVRDIFELTAKLREYIGADLSVSLNEDE